jgi:hypothetical protein
MSTGGLFFSDFFWPVSFVPLRPPTIRITSRIAYHVIKKAIIFEKPGKGLGGSEGNICPDAGLGSVTIMENYGKDFR